METFTVLRGIAAPLVEANISTDAIIPSIWAVKQGINLGDKLFANRRYLSEQAENSNFILNQPPYRTARILVAGSNFGCGSSREAAVWALKEFGIRCIIASGFGAIFEENCIKNAILPVTLDQAQVAMIADCVVKSRCPEIVVDLEKSIVSMADAFALDFSISPARRTALLTGKDDIALLRDAALSIASFEEADRISRPWVHHRRG